jgi:hypothetical protein
VQPFQVDRRANLQSRDRHTMRSGWVEDRTGSDAAVGTFVASQPSRRSSSRQRHLTTDVRARQDVSGLSVAAAPHVLPGRLQQRMHSLPAPILMAFDGDAGDTYTPGRDPGAASLLHPHHTPQSQRIIRSQLPLSPLSIRHRSPMWGGGIADISPTPLAAAASIFLASSSQRQLYVHNGAEFRGSSVPLRQRPNGSFTPHSTAERGGGVLAETPALSQFGPPTRATLLPMVLQPLQHPRLRGGPGDSAAPAQIPVAIATYFSADSPHPHRAGSSDAVTLPSPAREPARVYFGGGSAGGGDGGEAVARPPPWRPNPVGSDPSGVDCGRLNTLLEDDDDDNDAAAAVLGGVGGGFENRGARRRARLRSGSLLRGRRRSGDAVSYGEDGSDGEGQDGLSAFAARSRPRIDGASGGSFGSNDGSRGAAAASSPLLQLPTLLQVAPTEGWVSNSGGDRLGATLGGVDLAQKSEALRGRILQHVSAGFAASAAADPAAVSASSEPAAAARSRAVGRPAFEELSIDELVEVLNG